MQLLGFTQGEDWNPCEKCTYLKFFINLFLLNILICVWTSHWDPVVMQSYSTLYISLKIYECRCESPGLRYLRR